MARPRSTPPPRKPRADAQRNRERIIEVAKDSFAKSGGEVSLDDIAKRAGVGPGTLYRHFPTRGELLEAVYRTEVEKLVVAHLDYARTLPPVKALRAWMRLFVDYIAAKRLIAPALNSLATDPCKLYESTRDRIQGAVNALVQATIESGDMRPDIDAMDLLRALVGVSNVASVPDWPQSAKKLVDILIAGSRPSAEVAKNNPKKSARTAK
jgi:AcrR family transcriptional regulator